MTTIDQFPQPIDFTITGVIETDDSIGGWSIVPLPGVVDELGTRKAVKVGGTVDGVPFKATILPWGGRDPDDSDQGAVAEETR